MSNRNRSIFRTASVGLNLAMAYLAFVCAFELLDTALNAQDKAAQPKFKNLQVLKDVPPDQLIPAMQFISASLGVECEFCHVRDAFDKDDKQSKQTARRMIQMMFALDKDHFQGERAVTCYTCHRGSAKPVSIPMVDSTDPYLSEARPAGEQTPDGRTNLPSADDVIEKYVQAVGGAAAVRNVSSRVESGTITFGGPAFPVEILSKPPSRQAVIVHLPAGDSVTVFDGLNGWLKSAVGPVRDLPRAEIEGAKLDADLQFAINLKKAFQELKVIRAEKISAHDSVLLFAANPSRPPVELYFDRQTGLLLRQLRFGSSPLGLNPTQIDYSDYKTFGGVQVPLHLVIARPNRTLEIQLLHVSQNALVDDAQFAHP
jgi:photosynthetic reaction center cytochrome c subunit